MAKRSKPTAARAAAERVFGGKKSAEYYMRDGVGLEAGRMGRRLGSWLPTRVHVNTLVSQSGLTTLARARFLARNNSYARSARDCWSSNLVGAGIKPSWTSPIEEKESAEQQKKDFHSLFAQWAQQADADGTSDYYGMQYRVANELFDAGEIFVRKRPRLLSDGLAVPMQLQLLPSEMLPTFLTMPLDNGNMIRQGIEFDKIGRRVAYHFWRNHPGDQTVIPKYGERIRVSADQVLHIYEAEEAGQIRGLPKLTPSIVALWMLDLYDDAELDRKKVAALFSVFIKRPDPDGEFFEKAMKGGGEVGGPSEGDLIPEGASSRVELSPGEAHILYPGEDVVPAQPADSGHSYDPFQYRTLVRICAGTGLPYAGVTGDMVKANYSNLRGALIEARRRCEVRQGNIKFQLCRPVMKWFIDAAHIGGALAFDDYAEDPSPYLNADHIPPRWQWIDPEKDMYGEVLAIDAGIKARSHTIEETGRDPVEVDQRIAEDKARAQRLGLAFSGTSSVRSEVAQAPEDTSNEAAPGPQNSGDEPAEDDEKPAPQEPARRRGGKPGKNSGALSLREQRIGAALARTGIKH